MADLGEEDPGPDPIRFLDVHRDYLLIASTRIEAFAEDACRDVVDALVALESAGLGHDMVSTLTGMLLDGGKTPTVRCAEVAKILGEVIDLARKSLESATG
jgi:hypothetical protein